MSNRCRVLIFGLSYHGRAVYRCLDRNTYDIIGFLDNDIKKNKLTFGGVRVYQPEEIEFIDFDTIIVSGRYVDVMIRQLINELSIDEKKILIMDRTKIAINDDALKIREGMFFNMFINFKKIFDNNNIKHWIGFSSLLALKRKEGFSKFGDIDIGVMSEQIPIFMDELMKSDFPYDIEISRYSNSSKYWKSGDISSIGITDRIDPITMEPAVIDVHVLNKYDKNIYIKFLDDKTFVLPFSYFDGNSVIRYKNLDFMTPKNVGGYLKLIYGDDWKIPAKNWQRDNYNFVELE